MKTLLQEQFLKALNEDYCYNYEDILSVARENGAFADLLDALKGRLEYNEKKKEWMYLRSDFSGRDFYEPIPIWYIDSDEKYNLAEDIIDDGDLEDYDWGDMDVEDVKDSLYTDDEEFLDSLFDALDSENADGLTEHLISEWDWDEYTDNVVNDYFDGKITAEERDAHLDRLDRQLEEDKKVNESHKRSRQGKLKESLWDMVKGYLEEDLSESMWEPADKQELERLRQDIKKTKSKLLSQIKRKHGVWEYFGQKELRALEDKYPKLHFTPEYNALIDEFRNWCYEQY